MARPIEAVMAGEVLGRQRGEIEGWDCLGAVSLGRHLCTHAGTVLERIAPAGGMRDADRVKAVHGAG
jgi:hypothetical protein